MFQSWVPPCSSQAVGPVCHKEKGNGQHVLHPAAGGGLPAEGNLFQCIACPAQTLLAFFKVWVALHCDSIGTGSMEAQLLTSASSASEKTELRKSG